MTRQLRQVGLVLAVLFTVGLGSSAPPAFGARSDDHFGLLLHPIFQHTHGAERHPVGHQDTASESDALILDDVTESPALRSAAPDSGGQSSAGGMTLPLRLARALPDDGRFLESESWFRTQHDRAPLTQPPRLAPPSPQAG